MKESCPKHVILMKTKNKTFLTFLDKMQISDFLCLATYDWFCADGSHFIIDFSKVCTKSESIIMFWDQDA